MKKIVLRNSTIPLIRKEVFLVEKKPKEKKLKVKIYFGEGDDIDSNFPLGIIDCSMAEFEFTEKSEIEIVMDVDHNENLKVTVAQQSTKLFKLQTLYNKIGFEQKLALWEQMENNLIKQDVPNIIRFEEGDEEEEESKRDE